MQIQIQRRRYRTEVRGILQGTQQLLIGDHQACGNRVKYKRILIILSLLFLFSFILNVVWELLHGIYLYNIPPTFYLIFFTYCAFKDALLILLVYGLVAVFWKDAYWIKQMSRNQTALFIALGIILAAAMEYNAVFIMKKWSYSALMPTLFGIGLSPLLQLSLTGIFAVWLARKLI